MEASANNSPNSSHLNTSDTHAVSAAPVTRTDSTSGGACGAKNMKHFKKSMIVEYERIESSGGIDGADSQSSMSSVASSSFSTPANTSADANLASSTHPSRLTTSFSNIPLFSNKNRLNESKEEHDEETAPIQSSDLNKKTSLSVAKPKTESTSHKSNKKRKRSNDFDDENTNDNSDDSESDENDDEEENSEDDFDSEASNSQHKKPSSKSKHKSLSSSSKQHKSGESKKESSSKHSSSHRSKIESQNEGNSSKKVYCICRSSDTKRFMM
jgi:hypothetical protein